MDRENQGQEEVEASGSAIAVAGAIFDLADAIRELTAAYRAANPPSVDVEQEHEYDLAGNRI